VRAGSTLINAGIARIGRRAAMRYPCNQASQFVGGLRLAALVLILTPLVSTPTLAQGKVGGWNPEAVESAQKTVQTMKEKDKGLVPFLEKAYAYAVFSSVGKGAIGIGGAYGKGIVFRGEQAIGSTDLKQVTIGFQWGGQAYSEIVFFENKEAFENFTNGNLKLSGQASVVAVTLGASADLAYKDGIAIVTMTKGGLMYEASVGGQHFSYKPMAAKEGEAAKADSSDGGESSEKDEEKSKDDKKDEPKDQ
jgi:lipid-binding SYLF domain-containing protein